MITEISTNKSISYSSTGLSHHSFTFVQILRFFATKNEFLNNPQIKMPFILPILKSNYGAVRQSSGKGIVLIVQTDVE